MWSDIPKYSRNSPPLRNQNTFSMEYQYRVKKIKLALNRGDTNILVLGRENVGKTVFSEGLEGKVHEINYELPKTSKKAEHEVTKFGNRVKIISVIPGQDSDARSTSISTAIQGNPALEGVIYVTDWGFTDIRDDLVKKNLIKTCPSVDALRAHNLALELKDFKKICDEIIQMYSKYHYGPKWFLVVTNKVDLFYPQIDKARAYYHRNVENNFTNVVENMIEQIGENRIKYHCLPICAYEEKFEWNGVTIPTNLGGNHIKQSFFRYLIETITEFSK